VEASTLQGVTAASSGTHTRWCGAQASSLALSSAPACGLPKLPEGSRRDTGGGLRGEIITLREGDLRSSKSCPIASFRDSASIYVCLKTFTDA